MREAYNERDAMAKGCGLWFTDLLCTFQDSANLYLVMEFMQGLLFDASFCHSWQGGQSLAPCLL